MAISVDSVYQQVLAVANKEQRGYITPQEFNLFARKAQHDVFENTFAAYKDAYLHPEQVIGQHNDLAMLTEKMQPFRVIGDTITIDVANKVGQGSGTHHSYGAMGTLGDAQADIYWIESIYDFDNRIVFKEVTKRDVNYMMDYRRYKGFIPNVEHITQSASGDLEFKAENVFYRDSVNKVFIYPIGLNDAADALSNFAPKADYIKKLSAMTPAAPKWAYVVANNKALYDGPNADDFVLHSSEESSLVNRILELAGIAIDKVPLAEMARRNEAMNKSEQAGPPSAPQRR